MRRNSQKEKYQGMVLSRVFMSNVETRPQISRRSRETETKLQRDADSLYYSLNQDIRYF